MRADQMESLSLARRQRRPGVLLILPELRDQWESPDSDTAWLDDYDAAVREVALDRREIGKQRLPFQALGNYRRERIVDQEPHLEAASGSSRSRDGLCGVAHSLANVLSLQVRVGGEDL